jgi:hypothetical protein
VTSRSKTIAALRLCVLDGNGSTFDSSEVSTSITGNKVGTIGGTENWADVLFSCQNFLTIP